jgi:hypothetical protein
VHPPAFGLTRVQCIPILLYTDRVGWAHQSGWPPEHVVPCPPRERS